MRLLFRLSLVRPEPGERRSSAGGHTRHASSSHAPSLRNQEKSAPSRLVRRTIGVLHITTP